MANPNISASSSIYGGLTVVAPTSTSATLLLSNAASSGTIIKVKYISVYNPDAGNVSFNLYYYTQANIGGTANLLQGGLLLGSYLSQEKRVIFLEEDKSLGVTITSANKVTFLVSYQTIS